MKNETNTIKIFLLALVMVFGLSSVSADIVGEDDIDPGPPVEEDATDLGGDLADADDVYIGDCQVASPWAEPVAGFPSGQIKSILNKDSVNDVKIGGLALGCIPGVSDYDLDTYRIDINGATTARGLRSDGDILNTDGVFVGVLPYQPDSKLLIGGKIGVGTDNPEEGLHIATEGGTLGLSDLSHDADGQTLGICVTSDGVLGLCKDLMPFSAGIDWQGVTGSTCYSDVSLSATANAAGVPPYSYSWSFTFDNVGNSFLTSTTGKDVTIRASRDTMPLWNMNVQVIIEDALGNIDTATYSGSGTGNPSYGTDC